MLETMFRSMRAVWRANSEAAVGGSTLELPGVAAALFPAWPDRSVVNCVVYEEAGALERELDRIAAAYDDAGVNAWTVWVHESDESAQATLAAAGHVLDAQPMGQARELEGGDELPRGDLELIEAPTLDDYDAVIEGAYGWPGFAQVMVELPFRAYVARHEGRPAACLGIFDCEDDSVVQLVGTIPEARGRGLAGRLLAHALVEARERGQRTTTLQATAMGYPVYRRLGYRDYGRIQMWERRRPAPAG
jgi:GNAT superfamily N-acetyltransferase